MDMVGCSLWIMRRIAVGDRPCRAGHFPWVSRARRSGNGTRPSSTGRSACTVCCAMPTSVTVTPCRRGCPTTNGPSRSAPPSWSTRRPDCCPAPSSCAGRCIATPRSATTCRSRGSRCSRPSTRSRSTSPCTRPRAASPPCSPARKPGPTVLLRGDMDALPLHEDTGLDFASGARRPDARVRPRHAHGDARRRRPAAVGTRRTTSPAACCSCSSPARRAITAPGSCSTRGCSTSPALADGTAVAGHRRVRAAHHVGAPDRLAQRPRRSDDGVGRHAAHRHHRQGRPRQRAVSGDRPDPGRLRDRAGAADDGHAHDRRVRPVRRDRRPDHGRHDEQHHPGDGADRGHDPGRQRSRPAPRCKDNIRRVVDGIAAAHGVDGDGRRSTTATRSRSTTAPFADNALGVARSIAGADNVVELPHPIMGAEDFSYVLQRVPGTMMFLGGTPLDADLGDGGAEPLQPGRTSTSRRWSAASPRTRRWRSTTSPPADSGAGQARRGHGRRKATSRSPLRRNVYPTAPSAGSVPSGWVSPTMVVDGAQTKRSRRIDRCRCPVAIEAHVATGDRLVERLPRPRRGLPSIVRLVALRLVDEHRGRLARRGLGVQPAVVVIRAEQVGVGADEPPPGHVEDEPVAAPPVAERP